MGTTHIGLLELINESRASLLMPLRCLRYLGKALYGELSMYDQEFSAMADSESGRIIGRRKIDGKHLLPKPRDDFFDSNEINHYGHH